MCIFRCWQQCSTYNLFENLHTDLLPVETSKLWQKQAKTNFLCEMLHDGTRRVHTQKPGNSGFIQQSKLQLGKFQPRSQGLTEGKCEGADRENPKPFRLGKTLKITKSHHEIQRRAADKEMECLGCILILGNQSWAFPWWGKGSQHRHSTHSLLMPFGATHKNVGTFFCLSLCLILSVQF